jgi:RHS repeat-associated protein
LSPNSSFIGSFTPTASSNFNAKNQVQIQSSGYDSAGNQTTIGVQASTFDAEGQMSTNTLGGTTTYVYDGEGQRVMKQTSAGTTVYVYDAVGNLAAEYNTVAAASACGTPTCYVTVDQLGSTRVVTDSSGNVTQRYDYLPFGEEIPADGTVRTTAMGYQSSADGFNPKFTGQVRDVESGLDYFNARYYSPEQGRFVSVDPGNAGSDPSDPQTWNGYAYVGGNPMLYTDPSGEDWFSDLMGAVTVGVMFLNPVDWAAIPLPFTLIGAGTAFAQGYGVARAAEAAASSGNVWGIFLSGVEAGDFIGGSGGGPWSESPVDFFGQQAGTVAQASNGENTLPVFGPVLHASKKGCSDSPMLGDATYYNLVGNRTASGQMFNPKSMNAAMFQPNVRMGRAVKVTLQNNLKQSVMVTINDTGPFARGADGKAIEPLKADPNTLIDLTPAAFMKLVGSLKVGRVPAIVTPKCP